MNSLHHPQIHQQLVKCHDSMSPQTPKQVFSKRVECNWTEGYSWRTTLILSITLGGFGADRLPVLAMMLNDELVTYIIGPTQSFISWQISQLSQTQNLFQILPGPLAGGDWKAFQFWRTRCVDSGGCCSCCHRLYWSRRRLSLYLKSKEGK